MNNKLETSNTYVPQHDDYEKAIKLNKDDLISDDDIASLSMGDGYPMTSFQTKYFVVGDGLTPYRMKRQALVEIDTRRQALHGMINQERLTVAERNIIERAMDGETDLLRREVLKCEFEDKEYDAAVFKHKIPQARTELQGMIDHLKSLFPDGKPTVEDIRNIAVEDEAEERLYWQVRMAKQTAVDMIAHGRIGAGQMGSLMMMDPEDQNVIVNKALEFSMQLDNTLNHLSIESRDRILGNLPGIPNIEEGLSDNSPRLTNIQQTDEPLAKSETIDD